MAKSQISMVGDKWEPEVSGPVQHLARVRYMKKVSAFSLVAIILLALVIPLLISAFGGSTAVVLIPCSLGGGIAITTLMYLMVLAERRY